MYENKANDQKAKKEEGLLHPRSGRHWEDLFLLQKMPILVKSDDVRSGRKAKVRHGQLWATQESMG